MINSIVGIQRAACFLHIVLLSCTLLVMQQTRKLRPFLLSESMAKNLTMPSLLNRSDFPLVKVFVNDLDYFLAHILNF